ncbi:MAG: FG-GAP repeat domain-containing protein [Rubripirellula sp.]
MYKQQKQFLRPFTVFVRLIVVAVMAVSFLPRASADDLWKRHAIDESLQGADGVRLGDFNGDGLQDVVTGWEESGVVRLYLNPGPDKVTEPWPQVTVGVGASPEDAIPFDVDGDGCLDVISCHEGKRKQVLVHRFNHKSTSNAQLLERVNWLTSPLTKLDGQQWMFAAVVPFRDGRQAVVFGSKGKNASLTLLSPETNTVARFESWPARKLRDCGWIMSIQTIDMDGDGDKDIVFSDRRSKHRCVAWLEQPDKKPEIDEWVEHRIGASDTDALFIEASPDRVLVTTRQKKFLDFRKSENGKWAKITHANPLDVPFGKAIRSFPGGTIIMTANTHADKAKTEQPGVWLKHPDSNWEAICSSKEAKFDRMELIDLDADGDLDMMTCEERQLLGVIWYENPGTK